MNYTVSFIGLRLHLGGIPCFVILIIIQRKGVEICFHLDVI